MQGTKSVSSSVKQQQQQYQQQPPTGQVNPQGASYRFYAQSDPARQSYRGSPTKVVTQVTEETEVIQIPAQQDQRNEITYTVQDKKPKFEPVAFQVSSVKEQPQARKAPLPPSQAAGPTSTNVNDPNPFKIFGAKLRSRPTTGIVPSYDDQSTNISNQQTGFSTRS